MIRFFLLYDIIIIVIGDDYMKTIVHNHDNLTYKDINDFTVRARALLINDDNEILMGYLDGTYQFPGGHVEDEEELSETLYREVLEETGIRIEKKEYEPFYQVNRFYKSLDREGINRFKQFNYYIVHTNEKYDLSKRKLDQFEIDKNYELRYIPLDKLLDELDRTMNDNKRNIRVYEDIKDVITYYFEEYK